MMPFTTTPFPTSPSADPQPAGRKATPTTPAAKKKVLRVLVVDDHAPIRRSLKQLIELKGQYAVVGEGSNGAEAVEQVEDLSPDIVLMDMNMPGMNGADATRVIKERHPDIQVLALTAFADMSLVSAMVKAGASGYLIKGGSADELMDSLNAVARGLGALDKEITRDVMEDMADLYKKEQERADALEELDRIKREFISVVSHELRTPVTNIKGGATTLKKQWDTMGDETKREFLDSMERQCDRLTRLVDQILTVSGIQRGGLGLKEAVFDPNELVSEAMTALGSRMKERSVVTDLAETRATGDRLRLGQVAQSLIENALNFTQGTVVISTGTKGSEPFISVEDEGPGLSPETLHRLLQEPFNQGDSSSTRKVGGLGLSLYIARRVLEASHGRLEVETSPHSGSTFTMFLAPA
jgi:signal transduction histidine kinase